MSSGPPRAAPALLLLLHLRLLGLSSLGAVERGAQAWALLLRGVWTRLLCEVWFQGFTVWEGSPQSTPLALTGSAQAQGHARLLSGRERVASSLRSGGGGCVNFQDRMVRPQHIQFLCHLPRRCSGVSGLGSWLQRSPWQAEDKE